MFRATADLTQGNAMRGTVDTGDRAGSNTASVLRKTQLILAAFDGAKPRLGLTALARRARLSKATTYRLAQELAELGFLDRVASEYQLGWRIFELGQLVPAPARLRQIARPIMVDLHATTRAALHLMVPRGLEVLCVESLAGRHDTATQAMAGTRAPIWFTASGKLFLAHDAHREHALAQMDQSPTKPLTPHSARTAGQLRPQLTTIRACRWSREFQERVQGRKSVAVPITLWDCDQVVAALSVTTGITRRDEPTMVQLLMSAAADISRLLRAGNAAVRCPAPW